MIVYRLGKGCRFGAVLLGASLASLACRESEPPRAYLRDLGTGDTTLPPPPATWLDSGLKDGQADWLPFQKVTPESLAETDAREPAKSAQPSNEEATGPEEEARTLVQQYNDDVANKNLDRAASYFVERQRESIKQLFDGLAQLADKMRILVEALQEKLPGQAAELRKTLEMLRPEQMLTLQVQSFSVAGEDEVVGKVAQPAGMPPISEELLKVRFVRVDDNLRMEYAAIDVIVPTLPTVVASYEMLVGQIRSGSVPPEQLAQQVIASVATIQKMAEPPRDGETPSQDASPAPSSASGRRGPAPRPPRPGQDRGVPEEDKGKGSQPEEEEP